MYFAHSGQKPDKSDWQKLSEHLHNVAQMAGDMAAPFGCAKAAFLAGLFHDLGKYTKEFQRRLEKESIRVDHSTAGAAMLLSMARGKDRGIAELIAYGIAGHHAGLPDRMGETAGSLTDRLEGYVDRLDPIWRKEISTDITGLVPDVKKELTAFQYAFLGRMIFSCLVDADFKDTEAYYTSLGVVKADRDWRSLQSLLPQFLVAFEAHMNGLPKAETTVNRLRGEILSHIRAKANETPGLFTLTVPTGGGKTLASLAFALDHAKAHGLRRIIYAIPFTSIIDQTASIFQDILGKEHVLEHHSAIEEDKIDSRQGKEAKDKLKLAMEDWAAPVVVTTNVQFFESLFAARTSRVRKLHNIAGSVIILDEAQTIPRHLLSPCVRALDELARNYGCSIVLCTATQPALDERNFAANHPAGLKLAGRELAPDPPELAEKLRRVTIRQGGPMSNDQLIAALEDTTRALVIVNSRAHALVLYREAEKAGLSGLVHLTTRQCAAHRREILADVKQRLKAEAPCRVIATSLVEAGVDLDFPRVWRAEAGLDQIAQAAGRCNREGKRSAEESIVTIFSATGFPPPPEIKGLAADMARMAGKHDELLAPQAIEEFFTEVYWRKGRVGLDEKDILGRFKIDATGTDFGYRSVAADFRMIESGMAPVIVARDERAKQAVARLSNPNIPSGALARELQAFVVQIPPPARNRLLAGQHAIFAHPEIRGDQFAVLRDPNLYQPEVGLLWEEDAIYSDCREIMIV